MWCSQALDDLVRPQQGWFEAFLVSWRCAEVSWRHAKQDTCELRWQSEGSESISRRPGGCSKCVHVVYMVYLGLGLSLDRVLGCRLSLWSVLEVLYDFSGVLEELALAEKRWLLGGYVLEELALVGKS